MDSRAGDRTKEAVLDWFLALAAWTALPWLSWTATRSQGSWLSPGALAGWTWTFAAGLPLFLAPDMPVHPTAYAFVTLVVATCVLASTIGASAIARLPERRDAVLVDRWRGAAWRWYVVGIVAGCAAPVLLYQHTREFTGAGSFAELAMYASIARYEGAYSIPPAVRALTCATYFSATLAAFLTASAPPEQRRWKRAFAWLLPLVAAMMVHTAKATVLYGLVLFAAGWTAGVAFAPRKGGGPDRKVIVGAVAAVLVLCGLLVLTQALRMNRTSLSDLPFLLDHLRVYVVGHMPVFGHWFTTDLPSVGGDALGTSTFAGFAEIAGATERKHGLYEATAAFTDSNIYTAWRPLLEDFGVAGGLVFVFVLSLAAGLGWRLLRAGHLAGAAPVVGFAAYVAWSPITSIFVYSMLLGVMLLFGAWTWAMGARLRALGG